MNYFYKRHLWFVPLCIVAIWGIWAAQLVSAQSVQSVVLTASPTSLPATPGGEVIVTITYSTTEATQLFYYPPIDFEVVRNEGAENDPTDTPPLDLNGAERLKWSVTESGTKEIRLQVKENAVSGEKSHGVALGNNPAVNNVLTLTEPVPEVSSLPSADPDLIISSEVSTEIVEPGKPFTITIDVQNIGEGSANDIKVNLTSESMEIMKLPAFSIDLIEVEQSVTRSYTITPVLATAAGPHTVTVTLLNGETPYNSSTVRITVKHSTQEPQMIDPILTPTESPQPIQTAMSTPAPVEPEPQMEQLPPSEAEITNIDALPSAPESEPKDDSNGNNFDSLQWFLGGVIVITVLLLVALGIYSLLYARRQAKPDKVTPISGIKGQPYLKSSNGRSFPIPTFPFTIGRGEDNNLIIDETFPQWESMSRTHAQIVQHQQGYVIEDLGSQNKLRVQGRLTERNLLRNGWQILIGGVEFTFFDGSSTPGGSA